MFECDFLERLLHLSPLKHQRVLRLAVFIPRHGLVKMGHQEAVQASIVPCQLLAKATLNLLRGIRFGCRHAVEFREKPRRPVVGNREPRNRFGDLLCHFFFAQVRLRTMSLLLCAAQVVMALLLFGRDEAAALRTVDHSAIRIFFHDRLFRVALHRHDLLAFVEKRLRDERFVLAFVQLALEANHPVVDRILERVLHLRDCHGSAELPREAEPDERFADALERLFAGRVPLEHLPHKRCFFRVGNDRSRCAVVEVAHRGPLRPDAVFDFLALAAPDVFAQVVDVIFRLAEHDREHKFALGRRFKTERREFQIDDFSRVHKIDDASAVERIPREPVGMPRENSAGLAALDALEHLVEDGATRTPRRLTLDEHVRDFEVFAFGEFLDFGELIGN